MSMNAMSSTLKTITSTSAAPVVKQKKVEVRWLESESELYLKQWQHRYHQLVGLDNSYLKKNGRQLGVAGDHSMDDPFNDWCLSSKSLLDLDIDFDINYPKNNNIIISNSSVDDNSGSAVQSTTKSTITAFDHIFWSTEDPTFKQKAKPKKNNKRLKQTIDDNNSLSLSRSSSAVEDEDLLLNVGGYVIRQQRSRVGVDTTEEDDEGSAEDSFENIRIQPIKRFVQKNKSFGSDCNKNEIVLTEKERQFSIDLNKRLELLAKDQALNDSKNNEITKPNKPKPRARDRTRPARPRPPPIRRQIFKCEHIGCSYQSDRNFNFLRHKRTHRKNKPEDESQQPPIVTNVSVATQPTATVLADISAVKSTQTLVIINNNQISNQNSSQTLKLIGNTNNCSTTDPIITSINTGSGADTISIASVVSPEELQAIKTSIDCLLKSCDTTEDNLKISINNSNGITSSCNENHSYHQKVLFV